MGSLRFQEKVQKDHVIHILLNGKVSSKVCHHFSNTGNSIYNRLKYKKKMEKEKKRNLGFAVRTSLLYFNYRL